MALSALASKTDSHVQDPNTQSQSHTSRVTRSAARREVDQPSPHPAPTDLSSLQSSPSASRKRKVPPDPDLAPGNLHSPQKASAGRAIKKPRVTGGSSSETPLPKSQKRALKPQLLMAKPGSSNTGGKDQEKSPPSAPEPSKRKSSKSKKPSQDVDHAVLQGSIQSKRSKRNAHRKSEDGTSKAPETPKLVEKTNHETPKPTPTSQDEASPPRRDFDDENDDDDDDDGLPQSLRSNLFGHARSHAEMSAAIRSLSSYASGVSQRMRDLLHKLRQKDDPSVQLIALQELSELLLISNEDNLSGQFSPDSFMKELISLMQPPDFSESNPEMMLLACRCIANMMEALPASTAVVVYGGAVPILCQKLLEIDFIDLAEQALSTLEKISLEFPSSIVREGGLSACLNFLDFFATSTQRTAVTTAANCCKNIPQDSFSMIKDVMPTLLNVLSNSDQKVVEQGSICVSRIVESFKYDNSKLEELVSVDMLKAIKRLLQPGTTNLIGPSIHTQFLRVLSITARASPKLSAELLRMNIVDTLYQILTGVSPPTTLDDAASQIDGVFIMQALIHRPREQISETLNVICEILPPVQLDKLSFDDVFADNLLIDSRVYPYAGPETKEGTSARFDCLQGCKEELKRFAIVMFPTLTDAFSSTVNLAVRQKVLAAQLKMLSTLDVEILEESLRPVTYASFLASILSQQDHPSLVNAAIQAADLLLNRLINVYGYQFYREGVMAEVTKLASQSLEVSEAKVAALNGLKDCPADSTNGSNGQHNQRSDADLDGDLENDRELLSSRSESHDEDNDDRGNTHSLQDALSPSPSESSSDQDYLTSPMSSEHDLNILAARKFLEAHETNEATAMKGQAAEILNQLKTLTQALSDHYTGSGQGNGPKLFAELSQSFHGDPLSTITSAELMQSELVDTLLNIFNHPVDKIQLKARSDFLQVFMMMPSHNAATQSQATAFSVFTRKLQDLLSRAEHFEVITVNQNAFNNNRSNPSDMLSKQLRMRLVAEDEADIPRSYHSITISVHAIATFKSLDEYIRPRIALSERPRSSRHREGFSHTLAAFAAAAGLPSPHHRLTERAGASTDPPTPRSPLEGTPSFKQTRKSLRAKKGESSTNPSPQTENSGPPRRSSRKSKDISPDQPASSNPALDGASTPLECADERQIRGERDDADEGSALDAIVDDLDDSVEGEQVPEPSAVTMEVASTGKVTARKEDGTRVATPQSSAQVPPPPPGQQTPSSRSREPGSGFGFRSASRAMSYAAAVQAIPQDWHIEFTIDGRPVSHHATLYQAVQNQDLQTSSNTHIPTRNFWSAVHLVKFRRVPGPPPTEAPLASKPSSADLKEDSSSAFPPSLYEHPQASKILRLLNNLHEMNSNIEDVLDDEGDGAHVKPEALSQFVNTKLTAKLNRQLEEPLIVASRCLPKWSQDLARLYPFLFPFETRHLFLQSTSFGYSRSMARWQNQSSEEPRSHRHRDDRPFIGKLQRQKVRIQRSRIFESACKVMEIYGASPSILEIEYFDEVGTGLGPTLEFYATVSKEFSKKATEMWRVNEGDAQNEYAFAKNGMFPAPMTEQLAESENGKRILHNFKMLGKFVARSMLDGRIIDVSLNPIFFRAGDWPNTVPLSLGAVRLVDEQLARSLKLLKQYISVEKTSRANRRLSSGQKGRERQKAPDQHVSIDELSLDFTLPGYPDIELQEAGAETPVTMQNVATYVERVIDMTIGQGVQRQVDSFRSGFSEVFAYSALRAFTPSELVMLFGRVDEDWSLETLCDSIKADHGYNMDSRSVRNLLQVMSELTLSQRRDFLQFVTGSPKLPIGGFKSLNPMFTVVCRPSEAPYTPDDFLISVMTCQNYVKLPDYSDNGVLRERLLTAITEGQGAFHLS